MSTMSIIESATEFMENVAKDDSHGYSQIDRWGPTNYDCSGLSITAWQQAGVPVKTKGATYTGNMYCVFKKCGFKDVTKEVNLKTGAGLQRGDVLLNKRHHVAQYCGNGKEVEASINEFGKAVGGRSGDQTGREILIRNYRNYPWDCVLRYKGNDNVNLYGEVKKNNNNKLYKDDSAKNGKTYKVMSATLMLRTDANTSNAKIKKVLHKNDTINWYGYYKYNNGNKWLYVQTQDGLYTGYICTGENKKKYVAEAN